MRLGRWIVGALLVAIIAWGAIVASQGRRSAESVIAASGDEVPDDSTARAPTGLRVRVQVVNATTTRGLARRATRHLRARGFDVVEVGTARERLDTTLVLDRSGHPDWALRAARAMGGARVEARPDSSRYLDLTVLVGRTWRAPAQSLDP